MKTNAQIKEWMRAEKGWIMPSEDWHELDMALDMAREGMVPASQATRPESDRLERIASEQMAGIWAYQHAGGVHLQGNPIAIAQLAIDSAKALIEELDKEGK